MNFIIAYRNIIRNKWRSSLILLMIISAFIALNLFKAFVDESLFQIEEISTQAQFGHFQVAKSSFWLNENKPKAELMLQGEGEIEKQILSLPNIKSVSGRIESFGLLSTGSKTESVSLLGYSVDTEEGMKKLISIQKGRYLASDNSDEIIVGHLLATKLNLTIGDQVTIVVNTIDKVINAYDLTVVGFFSTGSEEIDKYYAYLPMKILKNVMQTSDIDLLTIKYSSDIKNLDAEKSELTKMIKPSHPNLEVRSWKELSVLYRKVVDFYNTQNLIIESILIFIVFLGISNTVGMSVSERRGEIGTLRAIGTHKFEILKMFVVESFVLFLISLIMGILLSLLLGHFLNWMHIESDMPGASQPIPIGFRFSTPIFIKSSILIFLATIFSTIIPVLKGVSTKILDALGKNI